VIPLSDGAVRRLRQMLDTPEVPGGRYQVIELLGEGGMGRVYCATDEVLGREVALKVLRSELEGPDIARRLSREARILARLEHPGIVPVHDAGVLADGRVFYVMKLVRGARLDEFAAGRSENEVLRVFLRVCETVAFAHAAGVVHRDLKPANVMVGAYGEVLVLDWGIARVLDPSPADAAAPGGERGAPRPSAEPGPATTGTGAVMGTPGFMPPEQARGDSAQVDPRSDVYSLGRVLAQLAGNRPRASLASIARKASSLEPADRYPGVAELAADVTRYLDALPVLAHRETLWERAGRLYQKYQTAILLVMAYLVMRLLFLVGRGL
jgi:serine/threonine protein kinase